MDAVASLSKKLKKAKKTINELNSFKQKYLEMEAVTKNLNKEIKELK